MTVSQLRVAMAGLGSKVKSDAQIRQWQHKYKNRQPDPANARIIELATGGRVTRQELRPDDGHLIWGDVAPLPDPQGVPHSNAGLPAAAA